MLLAIKIYEVHRIPFLPTMFVCTTVDPSPYFCMVRWHYYHRILLLTTLLTVYYYIISCFDTFGSPAWRLIKISVQYNGGLFPVIILLPHGYYHRGTRLNVM